MTPRGKLRNELTQRFLPLLRQRGFTGPGRIAGNELFHEFRRATDTGTHVLTIMFEKYQRPRCVIDLLIEPSEGIEAFLNHGGALIYGRAQPRRGASLINWFRADRPWWQRLVGITSTVERESVSQAVVILDEIDQWWQTQQPSDHISQYAYPGREIQRKYRLLNSALHWTGVLLWPVLLLIFGYQTLLALGLPLGSAPLEGLRLQFIAWIVLLLVAMLLLFIFSTAFIRSAYGLIMVLIGKLTISEAKAYALHSQYPKHWF